MEAETGNNIWQLFAGIGIFIFGMHLMEHSIKHLAGRSFKIFLRNQTAHPFRAVLAGLIITAILQSSSIVNLLVLAFVGAGILNMYTSLAIMLGSNLGSTVYNWIVVFLGFKFDIQSFAYPMLAIAAIGLLFFQNKKKIAHWTHLIFGLALLFMGLFNIKTSMEMFVTTTDFSVLNDYGNIVFVLAGFILTAIVQSSSILVVVALSALNAHVIGFEAAACLVIGSEPGTAIKTLLVSIGDDPNKKRVALGNFLLNLVASILAFILLHWMVSFINETMHITDPVIALVFFQSAINFLGILIFYPVLRPFGSWLEKVYSDDSAKPSIHLNKLLLHDLEEATHAVRKEGYRLIRNIIELNRNALEIEHTKDADKNELLLQGSSDKGYSDFYEQVKHLNGEILDFCVEIKSRENGNIRNTTDLINLFRLTMNSAKSIKDIRHNIKHYRESADDIVHSIYKTIRTNEAPFYDELVGIMESGNNGTEDKNLNQLLDGSQQRYDKRLQEIFRLSQKNHLSDLEMATLLNVFEGIRVSHEALINAIRELNKMGS